MSPKVIIILAAVIVLTIAASLGGAFFMTNRMLDSKLAQAGLVKKPGMTKGADGHHDKPKAPPIYVPLEPFVVNFVQNGTLRYLQITIELMSRKETVVDKVKKTLPEIRNSLILVLSDRSYEQLSSRKGKEEIRAKIKKQVNRILGTDAGIESVYLTGFVMQ